MTLLEILIAISSGSLMVNAYFMRNAHKKLEMLYKKMIEQSSINEENTKEHRQFKRRFARVRAKQARIELALEKR